MTKFCRHTVRLFACAGALALLGLASCDHDVGVYEYLARTSPEGEALEPVRSCFLQSIEGDDFGGAGLAGPDYASDVETHEGGITYRYYIAPADSVGEQVTLHNGELAVEIEVDAAFFESGDVETATFANYAGMTFDVYLWGADDCEGGLPDEPPGE